MLPSVSRVVQRLRSVALIALPILALQPMLAHPALAWWNGDWSYRMKLTADAGPKGANTTDPIGRTQILVRLHSGNFNFATAKDDGTDLRFVAGDDRTPLHYHIERFDGLIDQVGLVWVDVTDLAPGAATSIYMYWGNKNAANASDPRGTYDADQVLVYHFGDENGLPKDATGYANNALTAGKRDPAALIGYGVKLDGSAPIHLPQSPSLALNAGQAATWSLWVHPDLTAVPLAQAAQPAPAQPAPTQPAPGAPDAVASGTPPAATPDATPAAAPAPTAPAPTGMAGYSAVLYAQRDGANEFLIGIDHGVAYAQLTSPTGVQRTSAGALLSGDSWHHIAVEATDRLTVYVDGKPQGDVAATLPALAGQAMLGGDVPAAPAAAAPPAAAPAAADPSAAPAPQTSATPATPDPNAPATPPDASAPVAAPVLPSFVGQLDEFEIAKAPRPIGALAIAVSDQGPDPKLLTFDVAEESSIFGSGYIGIIMRSVTPDAWVVIGILGIMAVLSWAVMIAKAAYLNRQSGANRLFLTTFSGALAETASGDESLLYSISSRQQPALDRSSLFRIYEIGVRELTVRLSTWKNKDSRVLTTRAVAAIRAALEGAQTREIQRLNRLMVLLTIAISGGPFLGLLGTVIGVMITFAAIAQAGDVNVNAIAPGISAALLATVAGLAVAIPALFAYNYFNGRIRDAIADMQIFVDELTTRIAEGFDGPTQDSAGASTAVQQRAAE